MRIHHHPDDSTVLAYAAGALGEGFSLVLAAHMEYCSRCRIRLAQAEALGGELLVALPPVAMSADGFARVWERIQSEAAAEPPKRPGPAPDDGTPVILARHLKGGLASIRWRSLLPGVRQHVLSGGDRDGGSVRLLSVAPGTTIPHHTHEGSELTLVIKGAYVDEIGRFQRGDLAELDARVHHQPVADTDERCICLTATDRPIRFSGLARPTRKS